MHVELNSLYANNFVQKVFYLASVVCLYNLHNKRFRVASEQRKTEELSFLVSALCFAPKLANAG